MPRCCTAPLKEYDILLIAFRKCMDIPESYFEQVIDQLWKNKIEVWSVEEGKLDPPHVSISKRCSAGWYRPFGIF